MYRIVRVFLRIIGVISLVAGIVGIFLPLLPTTPLLLLSSWCFVRSSSRLYHWLINHHRLGPYIRQFSIDRSIPLNVKVYSITMVWITIGLCIFMVLDGIWWAQIILLSLAVGITIHILSFPTSKRKL
ncbi:MAG: YbaN family protein [Flavobacteriales bacterium]|nr:YbaN family protein [Flavobacteriales bacterium]